jgi:serine/threonine protein kinase/tetratricopeptide (TPR) repeat protein
MGHGPSLAAAGDEEQGRTAVTPERWQEAKRVLAAALDQPPQERRLYLDQVCTDPLLRREVESLIAAQEQMESNFLEQSGVERGGMSGTKVGPYEILELLGAGGMGEVYRAHDGKLKRDVAIKVLPSAFVHGPERVARFQREARVLASVNHPNIATIHGLEESGGVHYLVMELVPGKTLAERIRKGPLPLQESLELAGQIAEALEAAHRKGVVHRDLKPTNVKVTPEGQLKVLDFGLAKTLVDHEGGLSQAPTLSAEGILGTPTYMSPEQARSETLDARTDLFSFGIVLYEMVTGRLPFPGSSSVEVLDGILHKAPIPPHCINPGLPPKLEEIINKALEKECNLRYQSASDLRADLQRLKRDTDFARIVAANSVPVVGAELWQRRTPTGDAAIDSIAVLPLGNSGGDSDTEYLSDGISESIINNLAQLRGLRVMACSTAFRYKGRDQSPQQIGRKLRVRAILAGRLRRRGDTLIVQTELVETKTGSQLWGSQYVRKLDDVLTLQEDISGEISQNLRLTLTCEEKQRLVKRHTNNTEAYQLYLKGRFFWNKRTEAHLRKAISYFEQAVAKDPGYALAYTGLADSYHILWVYSSVTPKECHPLAKAAALRAVQIDDALAEAHTTLASIAAADDWNFAEGEREFRRAIALNPNYATAHKWYAESLTYVGRFDEARLEMQKAQELDPLSLIGNVTAAQILIHAQKYDEAIAQLRDVIDEDANFQLAHSSLRDAYECKHMFLEAIAENEAAAVAGGSTIEQAQRAAALLREAYSKDNEAGYWRARLQLARKHIGEGTVINYDECMYRIASFCAHLGDVDSTVQFLQQALEQREIALAYVRTAPEFQAVRSDPRIVNIMRQMGFPE